MANISIVAATTIRNLPSKRLRTETSLSLQNVVMEHEFKTPATYGVWFSLEAAL